MSGTIKLEEGSGGDHVGFKAPADIDAEIIWELPATDGADGQIMATDGAGKLSWTSAAVHSHTSSDITDAVGESDTDSVNLESTVGHIVAGNILIQMDLDFLPGSVVDLRLQIESGDLGTNRDESATTETLAALRNLLTAGGLVFSTSEPGSSLKNLMVKLPNGVDASTIVVAGTDLIQVHVTSCNMFSSGTFNGTYTPLASLSGLSIAGVPGDFTIGSVAVEVVPGSIVKTDETGKISADLLPPADVAPANRTLLITLGADVTTDGTIPNFSFSNLVIGKRYRIELHAYMSLAANDNVQIQIGNDGGGALARVLGGNGGTSLSVTTSYISHEFTVTTGEYTVVSFIASSIAAGSTIVGDGTIAGTWARITELNTTEDTSVFSSN